MALDETDWRIIDLLSTCYLPNNEVARRLGVSEGTVRRRLKTMQDAGVLRIKGLLDPNVMEDRQIAMVTANVVDPVLLDAKAREIAQLASVVSVAVVSGQFDLLIEIVIENNRGLVRFLMDELSTVGGLARTETLLILKSYGKYV